MVIIAAVSAFVGPKMAGSLTNMDLRTASKRIAASLRYARSQAVSETATYVAVFDVDEGRLSIIPVDNEEEEEAKVNEAESNLPQPPAKPKHYVLPKNIRIERAISADEDATSGLFSVVFFADGGSSGGTVILMNKRGGSYSVTVDFVTGTVELGEGSQDA
jgi:general secretion pathway protein H